MQGEYSGAPMLAPAWTCTPAMGLLLLSARCGDVMGSKMAVEFT